MDGRRKCGEGGNEIHVNFMCVSSRFGSPPCWQHALPSVSLEIDSFRCFLSGAVKPILQR